MDNYNDLSLLDIVETFADDNGLLASEYRVSLEFDASELPWIADMYGELNAVILKATFDYWLHNMYRDGLIHIEQYNNYEYVGDHHELLC